MFNRISRTKNNKSLEENSHFTPKTFSATENHYPQILKFDIIKASDNPAKGESPANEKMPDSRSGNILPTGI